MKQLTLVLVWLCSNKFVEAQFISPSVLAPAAWYAESNGYSLAQVLGEMCMVETFQQGGYILTQGFLQPNDMNTGFETVTNISTLTTTIYPNPCTRWFHLDVQIPTALSGTLLLLDMSGHGLLQEEVSLPQAGHHIITQEMPCIKSGHYVLKLQLEDSEHHIYLHRATITKSN